MFKFLLFIFLVNAEEKRIPPKNPTDRLDQLKRHSTRLMSDFFSKCTGWFQKLLTAVLYFLSEIEFYKMTFYKRH